jgi:Pyruvate/2-oxoacid:ferredoxin oxidoreductase delta subunit
MDGRSKFDKYTELWRDVERAREDIYFAQKDRELCSMRCPKCGHRLEETVYQNVRIDRCAGCGGVWLDLGELEALAPEARTSWLGELLSRMTGLGEDSR